jgi:sRNA-binding protein
MSKASQDLIATLCDRFPAAFSLKRPQPLKVGVGNEIAKTLDITANRKGRKQICSTYRHRATSRLYPLCRGRHQTASEGIGG